MKSTELGKKDRPMNESEDLNPPLLDQLPISDREMLRSQIKGRNSTQNRLENLPSLRNRIRIKQNIIPENPGNTYRIGNTEIRNEIQIHRGKSFNIKILKKNRSGDQSLEDCFMKKFRSSYGFGGIVDKRKSEKMITEPLTKNYQIEVTNFEEENDKNSLKVSELPHKFTEMDFDLINPLKEVKKMNKIEPLKKENKLSSRTVNFNSIQHYERFMKRMSSKMVVSKEKKMQNLLRGSKEMNLTENLSPARKPSFTRELMIDINNKISTDNNVSTNVHLYSPQNKKQKDSSLKICKLVSLGAFPEVRKNKGKNSPMNEITLEFNKKQDNSIEITEEPAHTNEATMGRDLASQPKRQEKEKKQSPTFFSPSNKTATFGKDLKIIGSSSAREGMDLREQPSLRSSFLGKYQVETQNQMPPCEYKIAQNSKTSRSIFKPSHFTKVEGIMGLDNLDSNEEELEEQISVE